MLAAEAGAIEIVELLLNAKAQINAQDKVFGLILPLILFRMDGQH